jgi:hypothetical protein
MGVKVMGIKDLEAGRLDALLAEVDEEYEAGLSQPL